MEENNEKQYTVADVDAGCKQLWRDCINVIHKSRLILHLGDECFKLHVKNLELYTASLDEARNYFYENPDVDSGLLLTKEYIKTYAEYIDFLGKYGVPKK